MIITINREFGSGGRELGKRLSDALDVPCYDDEIIEMITKENKLDPKYVARISESCLQTAYPMTIGHRFTKPYSTMERAIQVAVTQQKVVRELAQKGDCIIIGRCADSILADLKPFNIFVYADQKSKLKRCLERAPSDERLTTPEMARRMMQIDKDRARQYELLSSFRWGAKEAYDLCVNTSGREIKTLIPALALYCKTLTSH